MNTPHVPEAQWRILLSLFGMVLRCVGSLVCLYCFLNMFQQFGLFVSSRLLFVVEVDVEKTTTTTTTTTPHWGGGLPPLGPLSRPRLCSGGAQALHLGQTPRLGRCLFRPRGVACPGLGILPSLGVLQGQRAACSFFNVCGSQSRFRLD